MKREINLQGLIPPLEDCQGAYIERKISSEIGMKLYENGKAFIYIEDWSPQHINKILEVCKKKGYVVVDESLLVDRYVMKHYKVMLPEFAIVEKKQEDVDDQ